MFKIRWDITEEKQNWDIGKLFSLTDKYNGICLFTSTEDESAGKNIVGINPVHRFKTLPEIDNFLSLNRSEENIPLLLGYIAYDFKDSTEEKGLYGDIHENIFPELCFCIFEYYIVADNSDNSSIKLIRVNYPFKHEKLDADLIFNTKPVISGKGKTIYKSSSLSKTQFENGVKKIKDYIRKGDIYQTNLTRKINAGTSFKPVELAIRLKDSNSIEFGVFAKIDNKYVISTSPERFFKIGNGILTASPIKGTSPRYKDESLDMKSLSDLENSAKDKAELAMIVDLLRNDMNRICSNVKVEGFPLVMKLSNVYHLYSAIEGKLTTNRFSEILKALFPAGSITGCPKIRACQIIEELEGKGRGPYTGNFGYISFNGNCDFNIMIRTLFFDRGNISFNVGGGITLLSDAESEYRETIHKAKNIYDALNMEEVWEERYCLTEK